MRSAHPSACLGGLLGKLPSVTHCAAFASTAAVLAFAPAAHAVVVVSPASNVVIPVTTSGIYINVVSGATGGSSTAGWDINPWGSSGLTIYSPTTGGGGVVTGVGVSALPLGTVISSGGSLSYSTGPGFASAAGGWTLNAINYFGFRFLNETTGQVHFGYGTLSLGAAFTTPGRAVVSLFYESDPNTPITVGAIPEPSTWALMFGGLAAVGALARRRTAR